MRLAFEAITGEDLNWFFNQWFFEQGHPHLELNYDYNKSKKELLVSIKQKQDPEFNFPVFKIPTSIDIYLEGQKAKRYPIVLDKREQTFRFPSSSSPKLVILDPDKVLLARIQDDKTPEQMAFQYYQSPSYLDRNLSVITVAESELPEVKELLSAALADPHWSIRSYAIQQLDSISVGSQLKMQLRRLAEKDPHSLVRMHALDKLAELKDVDALTTAYKTLEKEQSFSVLTAALFLIYDLDKPEAAAVAAEQFQNEENPYLLEAVEIIFAASGNPKYLPFFERNLSRFEGFGALAFMDSYQTLLLKTETNTIMQGASQLEKLALNQTESYWARLAATKTLNDILREFRDRLPAENKSGNKEALKSHIESLKSKIEQIKEKETDEKLIEIYKQLRP